MCLILLSYRCTPGYKLVLAANRDEFLARPSAPLHWWDGASPILAGRDLQAGGTWFGVNRRGMFAALTNYRELQQDTSQALSRGEIVQRYLQGSADCRSFLASLAQQDGHYRGYNLLVGDGDALFYAGNRAGATRLVAPGIHGLSNHLLDSPWPKVERGKRLFAEVLRREVFTAEDLFAVLADTLQPPEEQLPHTGVGLEWEKVLSTIFIDTPTYGTRSSAVLTIADDGVILFHERTYGGEAVRDVVRQVGRPAPQEAR